MQVHRDTLLQSLECVQAGLSPRDKLEQSSCFVFTDEKVYTFNDEVACCVPSGLKITGAVPGVPMLELLRKLKDDSIDIDVSGDELIVKAKGNKKTVFRMEGEIRLPINEIEAPDRWQKLKVSFTDAVYLTHQCCGRNEKEFQNTCIYITPKYIEAFDNLQAIRYRTKTPIEESCFVRGKSIRHVVSLNVTKFSETETWLHFKNPSGLVYSVRRDSQERENSLDEIFEAKGKTMVLPKSLIESSGRAEIFSSDNADENEVIVTLKDGKIRVTGEGTTGRHTEAKKVKYKGSNLSFRISPKLLNELVNKYNECEVGENCLAVRGERFVYVISVEPPEDKP